MLLVSRNRFVTEVIFFLQFSRFGFLCFRVIHTRLPYFCSKFIDIHTPYDIEILYELAEPFTKKIHFVFIYLVVLFSTFLETKSKKGSDSVSKHSLYINLRKFESAIELEYETCVFFPSFIRTINKSFHHFDFINLTLEESLFAWYSYYEERSTEFFAMWYRMSNFAADRITLKTYFHWNDHTIRRIEDGGDKNETFHNFNLCSVFIVYI